MKALKISVVLAVVLITGAAVALAQGYGRGYDRGHDRGYHHDRGYNGNGYHNRGYNRITWMKNYLNLSDNQVEKIITINSQFRVKFYKNRTNRDAYYKLREDHRKAVAAVLTPAQKKKFNDRYTNRRKGYGRGYGYCGR